MLNKGENMSRENAVDIIFEDVTAKMKRKEEKYSRDMMKYMERTVLLRLIDQYWKEHLLNLDRLRQGINLRAYGQRDPLNEYKQEAFGMFENMSRTIREETVKILSLFELSQGMPDEIEEALLEKDTGVAPELTEADVKDDADPFAVSRNALCPCGSGQKYKHCCGRIK